MRSPIVGALALIALGCDAPPAVEVGSPAPAYAAVTLAGDSVSLDSLRGEVVLLNIWATWCHPCREEIPMLEQLHERYGERGFRVVGVSIDSPGEGEWVGTFGKQVGMTYPIWHDADDRISTIYQAIGVPSTYLIDREGVLRWRRMGPIRAGDAALTRAIEDALAAPATGSATGAT